MQRALLVGLLMMLGTACAQVHSATALPAAVRIHAHNDFAHARPLFDALDAGARSIEADIHLVNGELLIAHSRLEVIPGRTLGSLYLEPLRQRIANNRGSVFADGKTLILLIDIKSEITTTYPALRGVLEKYADLLTHHGDKTTIGPITAIVTGNRPARELLLAEHDRLVAVDGTLDDLATNPSPDLVPQISGRWDKTFTWDGTGDMSGEERAKLAALARQCHDQHRTLRLWATPDNPAVWRELRAAGVDWINTDHLSEVRAFLNP